MVLGNAALPTVRRSVHPAVPLLTALLSAVLLAAGAVAFGVLATVVDQDVPTAPLPVLAGQPVVLPDATPFSATVSLYGSRVSTTLNRADLLCEFENPDGDPAGVVLTTLVLDAEPAVVRGRTVQPMAELERIGSGTTMTCTGPAITAAQPVYVMTARRPLQVSAVLAAATSLTCGLGTLAAIGTGLALLRRRGKDEPKAGPAT